MNQVPVAATHNERTNIIPDGNWRSTLTASEQHAIIFHLVSALRAVSSNVSLEHLVAIVNAFEKHAYEKANSKMEYINICNTKLMHIKGTAIAKHSSLQTQNQQPIVHFFPQVHHQQVVSSQPKTFERSQGSGLISQAAFARSASQSSQQAIDSHSQFQQAATLLNPQMVFHQKQALMRQASTNSHLSTQNLMQSLNCSVNQQSLNVNSASDNLKFPSHSVSQQKALQIQQILNQLRAQNNQQQYSQYMTRQTHAFQSSDKHQPSLNQQSLNQQQIHMLSQADLYQQCSDGSLLNPSNINLQKLMALNQTIQTQNQNKKPQSSQSQAKQLLSGQTLQGFSSQMQGSVQQMVNPQVQKRVTQTTGPSTSHQEFKKYLDPHLNPCNYLIPQRILAQLPELPSNVSTWTQVAELFRSQRLSPEQMTRVHDLFYQHALYLQLHYQQIQQMNNQSANQFQSQSMSQLHSTKPASQIQQQQMRQSLPQMQQASNVIPSEFMQSEWFSEAPNFSSYSHVFVPNINTSLNNQVSQSQFQSIDQLLTTTKNDNAFGAKKRPKTPVKIKKKEDIKSVNDQHYVLQASNLVLSSPVPTQQITQFKQDSTPQDQSDNSIVQKILMCGGKEVNIQMVARLKRIQNEVERNGIKITPLNDLTSIQKQQVCELVTEMNQMYHRIDMLLPLFMALSSNESAVKQLLQMRLLCKNQFDVLPQGIYLCYPSQFIKIKKIILEYFKFVKSSVHAIQKQIENEKPLSDKTPTNLPEINSSISDFQHALVDTVSVQIPSDASSSKLFKTNLKNNTKTDNMEMISRDNFNIDNNFSETNTISGENILSSEKINLDVFDLSKESHESQIKDKVINDSLDYTLLNVASVLEADDVNEIFFMDKSFLNEKESIDILSNELDSEIISSLEVKSPQSFVTNGLPDQSLGKDQNDFVGISGIDDKLSSSLTVSPVSNEKRSFSSSEAVFSSIVSNVLEDEKLLNDINFDQCFDLTFNDKTYGNNILNFDKLQENNLSSVFDINEIKLENTPEGLEWDFRSISNIGPFKIKDFYASNNENIWNEEVKTRDLSTLGLGIVTNVY
ncbi:uncharacterized protein T551_00235 [Pneumocystis jirovecii RU7]|uniref:Mediator of RNA polymerase II transcription subunit 15 n=1 Tax=Pneumocystis jirovecii (strain RU7) TaxID=1408657 RepID=A0A0W4ZWL3_PNEJ7|nr:uncharacterized protein T551_00235 [Pneumocystis jirovecii RU7]KTW32750.1 hypothetical protein T551_00235 [Pneumocystis jirovecii RU7]